MVPQSHHGGDSSRGRKKKGGGMNKIVWHCCSCGSIVDISDISVIDSRGYWWHRPCVKMLDANTVDFPSDGKLYPDTLGDGER